MPNTTVYLMPQKDFSTYTKSKLLTAMLTPEGVYVFNVLAMGLCNAGDLFESALHNLLSGLVGVTNIADDIIVFGSTQEEHDANVIRFLERCLEIDLHLNPEKVRINCKSTILWDDADRKWNQTRSKEDRSH